MIRRIFSGCIYFSFEQTEMAIKATWINQWLDEGYTVLGKINGHDDHPPIYQQIDEAIEPHIDTITCRMKDETIKLIYGYKKD